MILWCTTEIISLRMELVLPPGDHTACTRTNAWLPQPHHRLAKKGGDARMEMACLVCALQEGKGWYHSRKRPSAELSFIKDRFQAGYVQHRQGGGTRLEEFIFPGRMPASCIFAGFPPLVEMRCNPCLMQRDALLVSAFPCLRARRCRTANRLSPPA